MWACSVMSSDLVMKDMGKLDQVLCGEKLWEQDLFSLRKIWPKSWSWFCLQLPDGTLWRRYLKTLLRGEWQAKDIIWNTEASEKTKGMTKGMMVVGVVSFFGFTVFVKTVIKHRNRVLKLLNLHPLKYLELLWICPWATWAILEQGDNINNLWSSLPT